MSGDWALRGRDTNRANGAFAEYTKATLVERYNSPDSLQIEGRTSDLAPLIQPGGGCTLADDTGRRRFSGPLTEITRRGDGSATLTYGGDLLWLADRLVYPDPAQAITAQTLEADVRTGPAETVLLGYVLANAGTSALAARRVPGLVVPASAGRGATITQTARLDVLGTLVASIAEAADLRITVLQEGTDLVLALTQTLDLSTVARFGGTWSGGGPGVLSDDWSWTMSRPTVTSALVGGSGDGVARTFREVSDAAATTRWGARVEALVDQSSTKVTTELDQAGTDALSDGAAPVEISATALDSDDLRIGVDVPLGALVTLDLSGDQVVERLRQVTTTIAVTSGSPTVSVVPVIGDADAALTRDQASWLAARKTLRRLTSQ